MRILSVRFKSSTPFKDLEASWLEEAPVFNAVPGLLSKTWIQDGELLGGIYTFRDQASIDAYVAGPIVNMSSTAGLTGWSAARYLHPVCHLAQLPGS